MNFDSKRMGAIHPKMANGGTWRCCGAKHFKNLLIRYELASAIIEKGASKLKQILEEGERSGRGGDPAENGKFQSGKVALLRPKNFQHLMFACFFVISATNFRW